MIWLLRRASETIHKEPAKWVYELQLWKVHQIQKYVFQSSGIRWNECQYAGTNILEKLAAFVFRVVQAVPHYNIGLKIEAVRISETYIPLY